MVVDEVDWAVVVEDELDVVVVVVGPLIKTRQLVIYLAHLIILNDVNVKRVRCCRNQILGVIDCSPTFPLPYICVFPVSPDLDFTEQALVSNVENHKTLLLLQCFYCVSPHTTFIFLAILIYNV